MDEFVSKKLLVAKFNELASKYIDGDKRQRGLAYATTADIIAFTDAEDVQPVRHGRWIWDSNAPHREHGAYKCSECGCHSDFEENYCYNCGARMDLKDGDTE